ncbi:MAG TPA: DNA polymerase III subunit delta [Tepidisphaeraceae bacterium]|jgi:DNA polymerase-3 subunit delta|nr:DNA polymerase III subunit delta [Tepidisphaeraceae bacterium]
MLKPVYALVGPDPFLQMQELGKLTQSLPADAAKIDVEGDRAELSEVLDELRSFAMFGNGKMVVVRDADDFVSKYREQLEKYVAAPSDSATLVLRLSSLPAGQRIHKLIAKVGQVIKCDPPSVAQLPMWITNRAKSEYKAAIAPDAARLLADLIGDELGRLDTELAKLSLQIEPGKAISLEQIRGSVAFQREQEMRVLTSALAAGQTAEALRRWRQLLQTDSSAEFRAVTWLAMWLEDVREFLVSPNTFKNTWKYKDDFPKFKQTALAIGPKNIGRLVDMLVDVDRQSKSGVGDFASNVERFLLSVSP